MDVHIQEELCNNGHDNMTQSLSLQQKTQTLICNYMVIKMILLMIFCNYRHTEPKIISIQNDIEQYKGESNDITFQNSENEITNLRVGCIFNLWENVDTIIEVYILTIFNNSYNHVLFPNTEEYSPKYRCIPDEILEEIQFLIKHENLPINTQRKLLRAKFSTLSILDCDLTNAIQKYKVKTDVTHNASYLLKMLIQYKSNDPRWFVEFQLDEKNRLIQFF
ncbi:hypothetical protein Glove_801g8 [Diversispora epigaea]|uniref:Uncharacterized protein n=1 Tax=Diversispora epigaea TaxID=1348612 RepID=A0A397FZ25_9GLOM|nr:hypothetical protein Glove_801g8 [Diversispora epigaea]